MYFLKLSDEAIEKLKILEGSKYDNGIGDNIDQLSNDPYRRAKSTNFPVLGNYYINAGNQHAITFDIDDNNKIVIIYNIYRRPHLYKLLNPPIR